jgi:hypothetical protein
MQAKMIRRLCQQLPASPFSFQGIVAERRGKLASYEVAGVGKQNKFVP